MSNPKDAPACDSHELVDIIQDGDRFARYLNGDQFLADVLAAARRHLNAASPESPLDDDQEQVIADFVNENIETYTDGFRADYRKELAEREEQASFRPNPARLTASDLGVGRYR